MRIIGPALFAAAGIYCVSCPDTVTRLYSDVFPSDLQKRQAIAQCASMNPSFNRLDADDRARCYAAHHTTSAGLGLPAYTPAPTYSFSPSHLEKNDIRRLQADQQYLGQPAPLALPTRVAGYNRRDPGLDPADPAASPSVLSAVFSAVLR